MSISWPWSWGDASGIGSRFRTMCLTICANECRSPQWRAIFSKSAASRYFPNSRPQQIARLETHGTRTETRAGEVLIEPGERHRELLVVLSGSLEAALPGMLGEELLTVLMPGDFTGEMSTLRGVAGFARVRVREGGAVFSRSPKKICATSSRPTPS